MTIGLIAKINIVPPEVAGAPDVYYHATIDSDLIDENLTSFPVCTRLNSDEHPQIFSELASLEGLDAAKKIYILGSDVTTVLNTEVDYCSIANGLIVLHTAITITSTSDYTYYIAFDASANDNDQMGEVGSVVGQSVWDDNFVGVYHCNEDPTPVADILDSTQYGNNMITSGTMTSGDLVDDWPGQGYETDGSDDSIYDTTDLGITGYPITMEAAALINAVASAYGAPAVAIADNSSVSAILSLNIYNKFIRILNSNANSADGTLVEFDDNFFGHVAVVHEDNTTHKGYSNGVLDASSSYNYAYPAGMDRASLNSIRDSSPGYRAGTISEARFSNIARSIAWLKATYHTLNGTLVTTHLYENLTDFTAVDTGSDLTTIRLKNTFDTIIRNIDTHVYKDYGVDYFDDFIIEFTAYAERGAGSPDDNGNVSVFGLANAIGSFEDVKADNDGFLVFFYDNNNFRVYIQEFVADTTDYYTFGGTSSDIGYFRVIRNGSTYFWIILYDDSDRTNMIWAGKVAGAVTPYRYLYVCAGRDESTGGTSTVTGYSENYEILNFNPVYPYEDLTTFTEAGTANRIVVEPTQVTYVGLAQNNTTYLYKDYGAAYFGDFDIEFEAQISRAVESTSQVTMLMLSNVLGNFPQIDTANEGLLVDFWWASNVTYWRLRDFNGDAQDLLTQGDAQALWHYWFKVTRSGTTITLYIYDDADRTSLVDTLSITGATTTYRYMNAMGSRASGVSDTLDGMNKNYKIIKAS